MTETAKTEKCQPTSDLSTALDIYNDYYNNDDMSTDELFEAFESNNIHPGDIESVLGNEMMCQYERWMYFNLK